MRVEINSEAIRRFIGEWFKQAECLGRSVLAVKAGDVHKALGLRNRMPQVVSAMRTLMRDNDILAKEPPSGQGSDFIVVYRLPR